MDTKIKHTKRIRRHKRVRAKIFGTHKVPRLCVFRSNQHIYAQLINDEKGKTILSSSDLKLKKSKVQSPPASLREAGRAKSKATIPSKKTEEETKAILKGKRLIAYKVGELIAQEAIKKKIKKVIFDRGGYKYHGRVKSLAEGARDAGLKF